MWKIERLVSKGDYTYAVVKNHPNSTKRGYVLHHRVVIENHIGRLLTSDEVVHHINENKKDNRLENLEVMDRKEHLKHHFSTGQAIIYQLCDECSTLFTRAANQRKDIKGSLNVFCSRSCNGRFQRRKQLKPSP